LNAFARVCLKPCVGLWGASVVSTQCRIAEDDRTNTKAAPLEGLAGLVNFLLDNRFLFVVDSRGSAPEKEARLLFITDDKQVRSLLAAPRRL